MEKKYYLPINSTSLAHYFGCACLRPSKYFSNKQEDLQDKFIDFLLITTHFGTQQTDCCLEVVFTKQEINELIDIKNGFFLFEKPLPITRVRKIYFLNKDRKEQTITNINMSTAFIPEELIEITKSFESVQIDKLVKPIDIHIVQYNEQLKQFDKYLGGLALLRLAGEEYMNYSENYFATLSFFNTRIKKDLEETKNHIDIRYRGAFNGESGFSKIIPYLNKTIDETDINKIAQEENQIINKDKITRIIDLNSLDKWTYTIAVLNTYGVGNESKKKRVDELILSNFKSDIKPGKSEGIALCYGINRGYSAFSNKYNVGNKEKTVKFQLNSQLDYYTLESVYQYAFNNIQTNDFTYLDWCPKQKWSKISRKTDYKILDVVVIGKKKAKVSSPEYLEVLLQQFFQRDSIPLFKELFEKVRGIIYADVKDEIVEEYENIIAQKQEEINKLKVEQDNLLESKKIALTKDKQQEVSSTQSIKEEQQTTYLAPTNTKQIIEQYLSHKGRTKKSLEDEARKQGINVKGKKIDEIIILLMTTPDSKLNL